MVNVIALYADSAGYKDCNRLRTTQISIKMAAKKKVEATEESTAVAIITPEFTTPAEFKVPNKEESLKIIAGKKAEYLQLTLTDVTDKPAYDKVVAALGEMKNSRIAYIRSATENVVGPVKAFVKKYEKDLEDIETAFKEVETHLRTQKDFIDNEKTRLKAEAELEKVRVMQQRVNDINVLGAMFDGNVYTFGYTELLMITAGDIKDWDDDKFGDFLENIKTEYASELDRIRERDELAKEQEEEQRRQQEETERLQDLLSIKQIQLRSKELKLLGFVYSSESEVYTHPTITISIPQSTVEKSMDEQWDNLVYDLENWVPAEDPLIQIEHVEESTKKEEAPMGFGAMSSTYQSEPSKTSGESPGDNMPANVVMYFSTSEQLTEAAITPKSLLWVFPDEFAAHVLQGRTVINSGKLQGLNWAIIKFKD